MKSVIRTLLMLAIAVAIFSMVFLPDVRADSTTTFATTAAFDAGTKSQPGTPNGNYQVETITDNLGIAANSFELGSIKGDSFTLPVAGASTITTAKWAAATVAGGSGTTCTFSITASPQVANITGATAGIVHDCSFIGTTTISGNWDVRVRINHRSGALTSSAFFCMITTAECTSTVDSAYTVMAAGVFIRWFAGALTTWSVTAGTATQQGGSTTVTGTLFWLRLLRAGTTYTSFHSTDGITYAQDIQFTDALVLGPRRPGFGMFRNGDGAGNVMVEYGLFQTFAGTIDAGGYRLAGNWKSALQPATSDKFTQIVVGYGGASIANFITAVSLVDSTGAYFFTDNTPITVGSSKTYTVPNTLNPNMWRVQVNLTGAGLGTINVASIVVSTVSRIVPGNPACGQGNAFNGAIPGTTLIPIIALIVGASIFSVVLYYVFVSRVENDAETPRYFVLIIFEAILVLGIIGTILPNIC